MLDIDGGWKCLVLAWLKKMFTLDDALTQAGLNNCETQKRQAVRAQVARLTAGPYLVAAVLRASCSRSFQCSTERHDCRRTCWSRHSSQEIRNVRNQSKHLTVASDNSEEQRCFHATRTREVKVTRLQAQVMKIRVLHAAADGCEGLRFGMPVRVWLIVANSWTSILDRKTMQSPKTASKWWS